MKNRAHNYLTKLSYNQIKETTVDRKKLVNTEVICEKAMNELKKIYWYEKELLIAIPMLLRSATTFELVESLTALSKYTREHLKVLETNFPSISETTIIKTYNNPTQKSSKSTIML
jgi:hypothetical protein